MDLTEEGEAEVAKFKSALRKMYKRQARIVLELSKSTLSLICREKHQYFLREITDSSIFRSRHYS